VAARRFRSDLYYRLAVINIKLPSLRERTVDLRPLVDEMLAQLGVLESPAAAPLRTSEFIELLARYRWPGNVRQLRNYVERRVAMGDSIAPPGSDTSPPASDPSGAGPTIDVEQPLKLAREAWNNAFEERYLSALLSRHDNNVTAAAKAAGVNRVYFYRLLWKHGLREPISDAQESS
jgi:transcriptional regulator with PAS, ATPase and Fis domain